MFPAFAAGPVVLALTATPLPPGQTWIAGCIAEGPYPACAISGEIHHPGTATIHVTAASGQRASVSWAVLCDHGSRFGHFTGTVPLDRDVRLPYARPEGCMVAADVTLGSGGEVTVVITGTRDRQGGSAALAPAAGVRLRR